MTRWDTLAIVGVGLIGGSIGLAVRRARLARRIVGIGRRPASLQQAKKCGAVTSTTTKLESGVAEAQLVIVCTPVQRIVSHVESVAANCPPGAIVTDAGSTKAEIVHHLDGRLARDVRFVGSHPMAGGEKTGPLSAREDLFDNREVIVTPTRRTDPAALEAVIEFWQALGARVTQMTPKAHDQAVAAISHLPHLVASALAAATTKKYQPLAATGWLDTTRVAAGDENLWQQIFSQNREPVLNALDNFEKWLHKFRSALENEDDAQITKLLKVGKRNRDAVGS